MQVISIGTPTRKANCRMRRELAFILLLATSHEVLRAQSTNASLSREVDVAGSVKNLQANPQGPQQAQVDPRTVILPVVDGKGIRFTRLSTEEGLSQTRYLR